MKKLKRNPEKFDVLELFANIAAAHGYDLNNPVTHEDIIGRVRSSFEKSKKSDTEIFGKRIESLFAYVVGALGKVSLLKQEDSGDMYSSESNILAPDYRLTFQDNKQILVEVKNFHNKSPYQKLSIKKKYFFKLKKYADLNGVELMFAVYFSSFKSWTLLSINSFDECGESYKINFPQAVARSEMNLLGDCMVGTTPNLELHLLTNQEEANEINNDDQTLFVTREVKIYCAGNEVTSNEEKEIAFYLIQHGTWIESNVEPLINDNKLLGIKFEYSPEIQEETTYASIGHLSSMITNAFSKHTVKNGEVVAMKLELDPSMFKVLIPIDYKGKNLPLWRFIMEPNYNMKV